MKMNAWVLVILMGFCSSLVADVEYVPIKDTEVSSSACKEGDTDCVSIASCDEDEEDCVSIVPILDND